MCSLALKLLKQHWNYNCNHNIYRISHKIQSETDRNTYSQSSELLTFKGEKRTRKENCENPKGNIPMTNDESQDK